jgi:hypothetical protein
MVLLYRVMLVIYFESINFCKNLKVLKFTGNFISMQIPESVKYFKFRGISWQCLVMLSARNAEEIKFVSKFGAVWQKWKLKACWNSANWEGGESK